MWISAGIVGYKNMGTAITEKNITFVTQTVEQVLIDMQKKSG